MSSRLLVLLVALVLAGCTAEPADDASTAPPDTITRYPSTEPAAPPEQVAKDNAAVAAAAVPTDADVPGFAPAHPAEATLLLCPPLAQPVPGTVVHSFGGWAGTGADAGRTLAVTVVLDPRNAPADTLLATLLPPDCADEADGVRYIYDRQPVERPDGWTGVLNTIVTTDTRTGATRYDSAYLVSKGDALVNVVAGRADRDRFDPSVDESASRYLDLVLERFAG